MYYKKIFIRRVVAMNKIDKFFGISEKGSTFRAEIVAGLTTFMTMVYILMVNANMFGNPFSDIALKANEVGPMGVSYAGMYIATAIGAIVGTLLMAFLAKMPLAQASGMGVNAFIVYTLWLTVGLSYANCMVFTLLDGVIFVLLTATGLRQKIFEAIPEAVRKGIGVGIGLFIAFIGFQNAGVIVDSATLVSLVSFNYLNGASFGANYAALIGPFVAIAGVVAIAILSKKNIKGSILWGILGAAVLYYIMNGIGAIAGLEPCKAFFDSITISNPFTAFGNWGKESVIKVFTEGFNFGGYLDAGNTVGSLVILIVTTALSLCMIDMFDTIGTLYGACEQGNLLDESGTPINFNKCMLSDAIATCAGAVAGTSTVTTFVESSAGVAAGGKTGFTALVVAICFALAMFLSPIAALIPSAATASALIWVGVLMMQGFAKVDWSDIAEVFIVFATFIIMALGYSISKGIGAGIIVYIFVMLFTGKVKEIKISTWVIAAIYLATFLLT